MKILINKLFENIYAVFNRYKQIWNQNKVASIPPELEDKFFQQQSKNNLYRIKNLALIMIVLRLAALAVHLIMDGRIIVSGRLSYIISSNQLIFYYENAFQIFICILFVLLIRYFQKKDKHLIILYICYSFIILSFLLSNLSMLFTVSDFQILYLFTSTLFLNMFIPDFKPKIFIWSSMLFYIITAGILEYKHPFFYSGGTQIIMFFVFIAILIIKILYYNRNVEVFIDVAKINILNEKLAALSITDELTKLHNRRSFLDYMNIIWKQCSRLHLPLSALMIDIDYFKKYNDAMGHLEGDKALIAIAQCMKNLLRRETDFVARFGGEEFVCLLPYVEKTDAGNFAKGLIQSVEDMEIPHPMSEQSKYITVSAGMASIVPDENNSPTQLLDEADKALYKAKQSGRNRVIIS